MPDLDGNPKPQESVLVLKSQTKTGSDSLGFPMRSLPPDDMKACQVGNVYTILQDKLSFAIIRSHDEAVRCQGALPEKYLFTADFQELYRPICHDFGPVNLGVIHSFSLFMRRMFECAGGQELVYYSVSHPYFIIHVQPPTNFSIKN